MKILSAKDIPSLDPTGAGFMVAAVMQGERILREFLAAKSKIQSPDPQPVESPVTAGSRIGPHPCTCGNPYGIRECLCSVAKSPNTPRESRAVNNAGERTEGKS